MISETTSATESSPAGFAVNLLFFCVGMLTSIYQSIHVSLNVISVPKSLEVVWYAFLGGVVSLIVKLLGEPIVKAVKQKIVG
jgi:hypothetical protein